MKAAFPGAALAPRDSVVSWVVWKCKRSHQGWTKSCVVAAVCVFPRFSAMVWPLEKGWLCHGVSKSRTCSGLWEAAPQLAGGCGTARPGSVLVGAHQASPEPWAGQQRTSLDGEALGKPLPNEN